MATGAGPGAAPAASVRPLRPRLGDLGAEDAVAGGQVQPHEDTWRPLCGAVEPPERALRPLSQVSHKYERRRVIACQLVN